MDIVETDSTVILKNANEGILNIVKILPWTLFYYEVELSNGLFGNKLFPLDDNFKLDDIVGLISSFKEEKEDIDVSVSLYFHKNK